MPWPKYIELSVYNDVEILTFHRGTDENHALYRTADYQLILCKRDEEGYITLARIDTPAEKILHQQG